MRRYLKYPKLLLLLSSFVVAFLIFAGKDSLPLHDVVASWGYVGTFFAGAMFAYSFTAAPATVLLLMLAGDQNILLAGLIAGVGALIADLIILKLVRSSLSDELTLLANENIVLGVGRLIPGEVRKYLIPVIASIIIASPLPDELGIAMLASVHELSTRAFSVLSYLLNTVGIYAVLFIGRGV